MQSIVAEHPLHVDVAEAPIEPALPTHTRADGTVVIDLLPLASAPQECLEQEPDQFANEIVVCAEIQPSPRLGPYYGPSDDEQFGNAVPRAKLKLSERAEAQANVINKGVGGWNANGGEVRVTIEF